MPDKSLWQNLLGAIPSMQELQAKLPSPSTERVAQQLAQLPAEQPASFTDSVQQRGVLLELQRHMADSQRQADAQGLRPTLGPMGFNKALGQMEFGAMVPAIAGDAMASMQDSLKHMDMKGLGIAAMSLPLLLGMAAGSKGQMSREAVSEQIGRLAPHMGTMEAYAEKVRKSLNLSDATFDYEKLARNIVDVPDAGLEAAVKRYIQSDLRDQSRAIVGRGSVSRTHVSADTPAGATLEAKQTHTYQSPYDLMTESPQHWNRFDLSNKTDAFEFKRDIHEVLKRTSHKPTETLQAMSAQAAQEVTADAVKMYNQLSLKADPNFVPIKTSLKLRDKLEALGNKYFEEGGRSKPADLYRQSVSRADTMPGLQLKGRALEAASKFEYPYKAPVVQYSAVKKFITNRQAELTDDELKGLLDMTAKRITEKVIAWADKRKPKSK